MMFKTKSSYNNSVSPRPRKTKKKHNKFQETSHMVLVNLIKKTI